MLFSKTFGYALRGILYIAVMQEEKPYIKAEEIANHLCIPKAFMRKILKKLVKFGWLQSVKGPLGGFVLTPLTLNMSLNDLLLEIDGAAIFKICPVRGDDCNSENPCPLHFQIEQVRLSLQRRLKATTFRHLLHPNKPGLIKSMTTTNAFGGLTIQ